MALNEIWNEIIDETITQVKTITELSDVVENNGFDATSGPQSTIDVQAVKFSNLPVGDFVNSFDIDLTVAAGNIRGKIYSDLSNSPNALLGETDSQVPVVGINNFYFPKKIEVPVDGIVWVAWENDATVNIKLSTSQPLGSVYAVTHTFGSGPDPYAGTTGTSPFWAELHTNAKVVKHYDVRGHQPENYFCIISTGEMETGEYTNRGSINTFQIFIDLSYRGVDYRDSLTKTLKVSSDIYDILHLTTLNGKVRRAFVQIMTPEDIQEGSNLYMTMMRVVLMCEKAVVQL